MKINILSFTVLLAFITLSHAEMVKDISGEKITIPNGYKNFRLISVSQRSDDQTLRAILGNDEAINAVRSGKINPWPNGTILAKVTWKYKQSDKFPAATIPSEFASSAFMIKDDVKFAATGGWGWGEWIGWDQKPYDKPNFAQECIACHTTVKDQDLVFTKPSNIP